MKDYSVEDYLAELEADEKKTGFSVYQGNQYQIPQECHYPNKKDISSIEDLKDANRLDMVFGLMKDTYRKSENFISGNVLYGDIDGGCSIEDFKNTFKDTEYFFSTSKSHLKAKGNEEPCERFHVFFPLGKEYSGDEIDKMLKRLLAKYPFFDQACKDTGRHFSGNKDAICFHNKGEIIKLDNIAMPKYEETTNKQYEAIKEGGRNSFLTSIAGKYRNIGDDEETIYEKLLIDNNKCNPPLSESEVKNIAHSINRYEKGHIEIEKPNTYQSSVIINSNIDENYIMDLYNNEINTEKLSSGFTDFDNVLNGGFRKGKLYVFAGISGGGKSILLLEYGLQAIKQGKNVLFISLEMNQFTIQNRINLNLLPNEYSCSNELTNIFKLNKGNFITDIKKAYLPLKGNLTIKYISNLGQRCKEIDTFFQTEKYDLCIIDYLGIMTTNNGMNEENIHFKYKQIAEEMRELAAVRDIPVLTAIQLNSDAYKEKSINLSNIAYSMGVVHTADFIAALQPTGDNLCIIKNRDGMTCNMGIEMNKAKYKVNRLFN